VRIAELDDWLEVSDGFPLKPHGGVGSRSRGGGTTTTTSTTTSTATATTTTTTSTTSNNKTPTAIRGLKDFEVVRAAASPLGSVDVSSGSLKHVLDAMRPRRSGGGGGNGSSPLPAESHLFVEHADGYVLWIGEKLDFPSPPADAEEWDMVGLPRVDDDDDDDAAAGGGGGKKGEGGGRDMGGGDKTSGSGGAEWNNAGAMAAAGARANERTSANPPIEQGGAIPSPK
jgi:hypothetical protein